MEKYYKQMVKNHDSDNKSESVGSTEKFVNRLSLWFYLDLKIDEHLNQCKIGQINLELVKTNLMYISLSK